MIKDQNLPKKKIHSKNSSENHSQTIIISIDNNHPTKITFAEDLQIEKFTKFFTKMIQQIK